MSDEKYPLATVEERAVACCLLQSAADAVKAEKYEQLNLFHFAKGKVGYIFTPTSYTGVRMPAIRSTRYKRR
jgi:hypothetical protein